MKNLTPDEIQKSIYGQDGLYKRVIDKINEIGIRKASELTEKSTQHINMFRSAFGDGGDSENSESHKSKPKLETISKIAECLGVE